jgi:cation transport ATPase
VGVGYVFSVIAVVVPRVFPASFRDMHRNVPVYFEAAAVIVALVLLGQVLELRARSQTGSAIRALLGLSPKRRGASLMDTKKMCCWTRCRLAICCAFVRERKCR